MKTILFLMMFGSVLAFAAPADKSNRLSDEAIRSLIPGAWLSQEIFDGEPVTLAVEYRADGTLGASVQTIKGRFRTKSVLQGTWRVRHGILTSHTESTGAPPRETSYEVVAINETLLILRDGDGRISIKRRAHTN
jgi:hypothetical protein